MSSKYTVVCRHCGRRNSKTMLACSKCGKLVELPLEEDLYYQYYQSHSSQTLFAWYHNLGIKSHRKRGLTRFAVGMGIILITIFFSAKFLIGTQMCFGFFLVAALGLSLVVVGLFELIANRSFASVKKQWQRELILMVGTILLLVLLCVGVIYIPILFD